MILAGVDIGNSTTEIAVARIEPGAQPEWLGVFRRQTTGAKGSAQSAEGVLALLELSRRRTGVPVDRVVLAELRAVKSSLVELGHDVERDLARNAIVRPASQTPSGSGAAAGVLTRLDELTDDGRAQIAIVGEDDFAVAANALCTARNRGALIVGVLVQHDDAVLIGNRFDRAVPIVDEVVDIATLPLGAFAAIEVAEPGETITTLADPLALAELLQLDPAAARAARVAARAVAGRRCAIIVRDTATAVAPETTATPPLTLQLRNGAVVAADTAALPPAPGSVMTLQGALGQIDDVLDLFWQRLPRSPEPTLLQRRLVEREVTGIALLCTGVAGDAAHALRIAGLTVDVVARESEAAVLGAATTPRAGETPFVIDIGGGTVDLHRAAGPADQAVVCAGAGQLVTRICAGVLGCDEQRAESAKRHRSIRVETPFVLHHEDGTRSFLGEPAAPETLGRLCTRSGSSLEPLSSALSPEQWRALRRDAKRSVIGRNVRRALDAAGGVPRGELVTLVGGCASDPEVLDAVTEELAEHDLAVARGNVLGIHGPRAAVAVGLVLATRRA